MDSSGGSPSRLRFAQVGRHFRKGRQLRWALKGVDLDVAPHEFVALVGPSGCGKSTLLNMAAGLLMPSSGSVHFDGGPVTEVNTRVGYVTQRDNLLPWRTVQGNIELPLEIREVDPGERRRLAAQIISLVGLEGFEKHYPGELSGGMRTRVNLARTLVYATDTWLMDEPFAALDAQLKLLLQDELVRLQERFRTTVLYVTHDLSEAVALADRVVVLGTHPGHVRHIEVIPTRRPRNVLEDPYTPEFNEIRHRLWNLIQTDLRRRESA